MSPKKNAPAVGERLPYLLSKLKAPRVLERLEQTAARARDEQWPYEQFLEALLEAEVFARDASGARSASATPPSRPTRHSRTSTSRPSPEPPPVAELIPLPGPQVVPPALSDYAELCA